MPFDDTTQRFTETTDTPTLQILRAMRHRLRSRFGWCKGELNAGSRVCLVGALHQAQDVHYPDHSYPRHQRLPDGARYVDINYRILAAAHRVTGQIYPIMEYFNDARATHHIDIIAALDRAIEEEQLGLWP